MADSDDFGELDDSAFLEAATQAEKENTPPFLASPRPWKRRKIAQTNERIAAVAPRTARRSRAKHVDVDSSDDDGFMQAPGATTVSPERTSANVSDEEGDYVTSSTPGPTPQRSKEMSKRRRKQLREDQDKDEPTWKKYANRKLDRIHTPTVNLELEDTFFTQPPREHSPPWKTRGPIWQKPPMSIGVHRPGEAQGAKRMGQDALKTITATARQSIASRSGPGAARSQVPAVTSLQMVDEREISPALVEPGAMYDPALELADLPSDAFASSSSSPQKQHEGVEFVSERRTRVVAPQVGLRQTTLFGRQGIDGDVPLSQGNKRYNFVVAQKDEPPTHHKLDLDAMKTWVYPTNLGKTRDYQFNIVARGLFHNLLVALPTGLGKTFIAATIMLNWFRWTQDAQIVFVAPTKPLVTQQAEACFNIVGIPRSETTLLIGGVPPGLRAEEWAAKRVFFMTPQTLLNDLKSGYADPKKIVLLVVDEAHRATGSYAYVEVVALMRRFNPSFRILALTATPGADVESVQKVIDGLDISKIEIRTENSLDIRDFVHQRKVEKHVFSNSDEMQMCMDLYSQALQPIVNKLAGLNAFWSRDPLDLTPYGCMQARKKYMEQAGRSANTGVNFMVNNIFTILGSISMAMDLLKFHGIGSFYTKMKEFRDNAAEKKSKYKKEIIDSDAFKKLLVRLQGWVADDTFVGHPKLEFLQDAILDHFVNAAEGRNPDGAPPAQTRIMVFAHWRDSAEEIVRVLSRHPPMIRPSVFVGQASAKNSEGMSQKEQLQVIEKFKKGTFNTLVATSIGEEGLDIGEVDLIICYDSKASPIRMLQRMGRTGRKREGKIILLQMQGKEETDFIKAKDNYESMQKLIAEGSKFDFHDDISRRIVPQDIKPVVDMSVVDIPLENSQADLMPVPKAKGRPPKRPPKKFHMPDGVITGFVNAGRMDEEVQPKARAKKKIADVLPSEQPAQVPPLEEVLLTDGEMKTLERDFQTVYHEDDTPIVAALDFCAHPERQRVLSRTTYFPQPGRVAQGLVATLRRMHAMDEFQLDWFEMNVDHSDLQGEPDGSIVVPDDPINDSTVDEDVEMWKDDDPASPPLPQLKAKPGPKPKAKAASKTTVDRARPIKPVSLPAKPVVEPEVHTTSTTSAPRGRGRPRKNPGAATTPARQPKARTREVTPKTPTYRVSDLVAEGVSSSPPPTDPAMRLGSQAESIGSDDTLGMDDPQDTQAYRDDSDLASFIADDDDDEGLEAPRSSLPSFDANGFGRGTQAVVNAARPSRRERANKIFTSDPTDDDAVVTSDSDSEVPVQRGDKSNRGKSAAVVVDSDTDEGTDVSIVPPPRRIRRIVDTDDDDDDD